MLSLVALIPVLDRPRLVSPLIESFAGSLPPDVEARLLFIATPGDARELRALEDANADYVVAPFAGDLPGQYARKINHGVELTAEEWIFTGADDLAFRPGWLDEALRVHEETCCLVVGTNDCANPTVIAGRHATHSLVHRSYVALGTVEEPGKLLHEGYDHNSVDCEFCETAQSRDQFAHAAGSIVEHLHPTFNRKVRRDSTYVKGLRNATADKRLFHARRHLWGYQGLRPSMERRLRSSRVARR